LAGDHVRSKHIATICSYLFLTGVLFLFYSCVSKLRRRGRSPCRLFISITSIYLSASALHCSKDGGETSRPPSSMASSVDGHKALQYIDDIIALGPRHPGTEGLERTRKYILSKLESFGLKPVRHDFVAMTPHPDLARVAMANITVDIEGPGDRWVLLGGHFDGKLLDGIDFKGANDGGSSTALLLEFARVLSLSSPPCPIRIVFFDGEEALTKWSDMDSCYGSKNLAMELKKTGEVKKFAAAVIVDMVGDKRLRLQRETLSTGWVFNALEKTAKGLGYGSLFGRQPIPIEDDHVPLLTIGIPAANLIDLRYGPGYESNAYWHTEEDSPDKLSHKSIEMVGQIVLDTLPTLCSRTR
jgi:glutaminyl-peptide cyclotransferase